MLNAQNSSLDPTKLLTRRELATVLAEAKRNASRSANTRRNLILIVRLACCCGLRVSEIAGLRLDDVVVDVGRPHLRLRKETTKGKKPRCVPLWWDSGTLADLVAWKAERVGQAPAVWRRSSAACRRIALAKCCNAPPSGAGSCQLARCSEWRGGGRSQCTTVGALLLAMRLPAGGTLARSVPQLATPTSR